MAQFLDLTGLGHFKDKNDALYAKQDGSYELLTSGNAEQLVSTVGVEDNAPYVFRTTGGSADVGDRMNLKAVVGGTVVWNQYCDYNESTPKANWSLVNATLSISGHKMTITSSSNSSERKGVTLKNFLSTANHKYLVGGYITPDASNNAVYGFYNAGVAVDRKIVPYADGKTDITTIFGISASGYDFEILTANATPSGSSCVAEDVMLTDLTAMFGSTIADYAYTLESGTAGAGIAWLKKYGWFTKPYYPYAAASLQSVKTSAHITYGFNAYNPSTGKAKVVGGMVYQITGAYTALSLDGTSITPDANGYFTPSANGELTVTGGNGTTTCVHLNWDGERDGEYEPYSEHTYALDDVELRGIPKKDANNNLYYDGDEYTPDGTVTRYWGKRAYTDGDETDGSTMITDGTNTVYKLTTPTTESADPYTELQICDDFGTEEFVDAATRDFEMPCGSNAVYQPNLRAKLEMAPNSPSNGNGDYIVRQTDGVNEYVLFSEVKELPDLPTTDGTYTLKCTVADGTATLSWVSE